MPRQPLAEVFGFPVGNLGPKAQRHRQHRLCPFNNTVPNCTKDRAKNPLGVCSIRENEDQIAVTCPIRFREDWLITDDAASFFFMPQTAWTSLTEIRLNDRYGKSAGNIDIVLVAYDDHGQILDFGSVEVQAVYISGNVRRPFAYYLEDPASRSVMDWSGQPNYPRPDYLSSSRKRLVPQLIYKGGILKSWGKKQAVVLHQRFFETLPDLPEVGENEADIAWLIYDLEADKVGDRYHLQLKRTVYTEFQASLDRIIFPEPGPMEDFLSTLQTKLDAKLDDDSNPPAMPTLADFL